MRHSFVPSEDSGSIFVLEVDIGLENGKLGSETASVTEDEAGKSTSLRDNGNRNR